MATATESTTNLFKETVDSLRMATESVLKMQQEMYGQWAAMWPGYTPRRNGWTGRIQQFQGDWSGTITEMMRKHRETLDSQYRAGIDALEEAFRVAASKDPEELREYYEALCRNALELMKETSKIQMTQFQEAMQKWVELCQAKP